MSMFSTSAARWGDTSRSDMFRMDDWPELRSATTDAWLMASCAAKAFVTALTSRLRTVMGRPYHSSEK